MRSNTPNNRTGCSKHDRWGLDNDCSLHTIRWLGEIPKHKTITMAEKKKRFTFAAAKEKIKELEDQLEKAIQIIDASDNIYTEKENRKIKYLEVWAILGPLAGLTFGLFF